MRPAAGRRTWSYGLMFGAGIVLLLGCPPPREPKKLEMQPIGTLANVPTAPPEVDDGSDVTTPNSGTPSPGTTTCGAPDFDNLEDTLKLCEVPMPRPSEVPSIKDKLEVTVTSSTPTTTPGGRVDLQITLRNKTSDPLALYFTGDPSPRFDVEAVDAKGRRVDIPPNKWPGYPKGYKPEAREAKAAKVTLDKNGSARVKLVWDAVKTKWAPERARSWEGRGYPRMIAGPLGVGKYSLRVVLPLLGDVAAPKVAVEVTKTGGGTALL
ncbi:MAG: hypothetical protein KF850_23325 [Labilithrix sp.]|nr:hypothetical protein [Labilithrix sp.]MBX3214985.1 hypothetical protein [Labilithrix sp.]